MKFKSLRPFIKFLIIALGIFLALFILIGVLSPDSPSNSETGRSQSISQPSKNSDQPTDTKPNVPYTIKKEENFNVGILIRKNFRVVMSSKATEQEVKSVIDYIIRETINRDNNIDEISVLVYDREKDVDGAYTLAKGDWAFNGQWGSTSQDAGQKNDRTGYKTSYDLKKLQADATDKPTDHEMEVYNYYWDILNEPGNPAGTTVGPLWLEDANPWERERMIKVLKKYNLSNKQLADIISKIIEWRYK